MDSRFPSGVGQQARRLRAKVELALAVAFDERAARDEDLRARAGEHEDKVTFLREFEGWLDGRRNVPPDPVPSDFDKSFVKND